MEIAVMADLAAGKARVLEAADMRENRFALAEQALRQRRCGLGQAVRVGLQHLEHAGRACGDGLAPARAVLGRDRLRREAVDVMTCQRVMQLGGAPADLPHALQHRGHLGRLGGDFVGQQALLVDQPVKRGAGDTPGIALVLDEGMHGRERGAGFALDQLDGAQQRRRIPEMRHIGQEAPDLEFRMDARRHLAEDLDDVLVVDNHAAVRLLAIDRMDGLDLGRLPFERRRRPEFDFLVAGADRFAGAELGEQDRDELGLGGGIEQRALASSRGGRRPGRSPALCRSWCSVTSAPSAAGNSGSGPAAPCESTITKATGLPSSYSTGTAAETLGEIDRESLSANQRRSGIKLGSTSASKVRRVQLDSAFSQPCPMTSVVMSRGRTFSGSPFGSMLSWNQKKP